ncbi:MAG: CopD family protein [Chitinophagales bacterium]
MNAYPYILACHIIFIVTWFAGLFYIVRLFIYHREALDKQEPEKQILSRQFTLMESRLLHIITTPSMLLALGTGITLLSLQPTFLQEGWMHVKLFFVACVVVYHFSCLRIHAALRDGKYRGTGQRLRMYNELATLFLVAIVFLVVLKNTMNMLAGFGAFIALAVILMLAIRLYKRSRKK